METAKLDLKVILLGQSGAGKTSLLHRFVENSFEANQLSTVGASFKLKTWHSHTMGIWDTAGQERYQGLSSYYCRAAGAAILVYDVSSQESFEALPKYLALLRRVEPNCYCIMVGSKCDYRTNSAGHTLVDSEVAAAYAAEESLDYIEASALDGTNVELVFSHVGDKCLGNRADGASAAAPKLNLRALDPLQPAQSKKCCS